MKAVTAEKAKALMEKPLKKRVVALDSVLGVLKKISASNKAAAQNSSQDNSPGNRSAAFSHTSTSITQNLKAKSLKSPTPIMPGGHKRPADQDSNGMSYPVLVLRFTC